MARALVIGGTAFIGRALVERLLARGDEVAILHRGATTPFGERVRSIRCDRNDVAAVRAALADERFDIVFDNVYDWERGTPAEPVAAAAEAVSDGLRRYVFVSSIAAYGGGMDHDERDSLAPPDHPEQYGREKAESERALFRLHAERGTPVTTLRPAFVYGPHNYLDRETFFWDRIVRDRPVIVPGDGERVMQFVSADDVARVAIAATEREAAKGAAYNLGNWPPISQVEFVRLLAHVAGRDAEIVHVPREHIEAAGGGLLAPPFYFGVYLDLPSLTVRVERVRTDLGITITSLEQGLRETFEWYRGQDRPEPDFSWEDALLAKV